MTKRLILRFDENWPATPVAAWVLLGPDGKLQAQGESDPQHWPAADECDVVLAGAQCLWLETDLPKAARRDAPRLLAYALEDRLLSDPDSQHLTISHRRRAEQGNGETVGVLVIARERMRLLLAQLKAIGRQPGHFFSESSLAPADDENWHVAVSGSAAIVRSGPNVGYAVDTELLAPVLEQQLAAARAANRLPAELLVHLAPGTAQPDLATIDEPPVRLGAPYEWWQTLLHGTRAGNLLHGDFAVAGHASPLIARCRRPMQLAGVALAVWLLASLGEVLWLRHQLSDLDLRMQRTYQVAFPNSPAIAPAAQMRQQLNLARARHGQLRDDDALALLASVAEVLGGAAADNLQNVRYADGQLDLVWKALAPESIGPLQAQFASRGLHAEISGTANERHLLVRPEVLP